jgi:Putative transposase DNA-binding domain
MIVYRYGLAAPHEERERILDQISCAHRYRNALVEIERARRAALRALYAEQAPDFAALLGSAEQADADVIQCVQDIRRTRAKARKRAETTEQKAALKEARDRARVARAKLRDRRRELKEAPAIIAGTDEISERALEKGREARAASGLANRGPHYGAWGTYQLVEDAAKASFKDTPLYSKDDDVTPNDPQFVRRTGEGAVSVQIQGGATLEQVLSGEHKQLRIKPPDERAWIKPPRGCLGAPTLANMRVDAEPPCGSDKSRTAEGQLLGWADRRRLARQGELALCLGTDEEGTRIYGRWRLDMHRPLPKGAVIKRATVSRGILGPHDRWTLELTVDAPPSKTIAAVKGGAVSIDIGWRKRPDGRLRVAAWANERGERGEFCLESVEREALQQSSVIRGERDHQFDMTILRLTQWIDAQPTTPEWLTEARRVMRLWRAAAKLVRLRNTWRENRLPNDEIVYEALHAWAEDDWHRWRREGLRREQALRRRLDKYRVFAAELARDYDEIVIEQFDLRRVAERAPVDGAAENEEARSNRVLANTSSLRSCIVNAGRRRGRLVAAIPAVNTTRQCPTCGLVEKRDSAKSITLACECGAVWDQDTEGAAPVLLARWRERPGDAKMLWGARDGEKENESAEVRESRRERVKRQRAEKLTRMAAAREAAGKNAEG